jgi:hypothetical protein
VTRRKPRPSHTVIVREGGRPSNHGAEANPGALGDHRLDVAVGAHDVERLEPRRHQRLVQAIALVRPVENDPRHVGIGQLLQDQFPAKL